MALYSDEFKEAAVKKSFQPREGTLSKIAEELGIPPTTLFRWRAAYANKMGMGKTNKKMNSWTAEEKLQIIAETYSMDETTLGQYLRSKGLYTDDLERFKQELISGAKASKGRPKKDPELMKSQAEAAKLKKELRRKDKALAEMSARVILLKKSHEIWGVPEDEE